MLFDGGRLARPSFRGTRNIAGRAPWCCKDSGPMAARPQFSVSAYKEPRRGERGGLMNTHGRFTTAGGISLLWLLTGAATAHNQLTVRVANGPYAGSYQSVASETICMKAAAQDVFSSAWKDFGASGRGLAEAGVQVDHPDGPGAKRGDVRISFGKDGKAAIYQLLNQPLTFTPTAQGAHISADGRTADGIGIHVEAVCAEVERL
jgi:hypothetical protein